jgi:hypothetical protein
MNITTLKKFIPYLAESKITALIWGSHGIGKSTIVKDYAEENGYWFFNLRIGNMSDVGDLLGLKDFELYSKVNKIASKMIMPEWTKSMLDFCEENPDKKAILFLDEINRIKRPDLIAPIFQIALDYRLHTYTFPKNVYIIAAANPHTDDFDTVDLTVDKALISRFCHIKLSPTSKEWFDYAAKNNIDFDIINFLQEQPAFLEGNTQEFGFDFVSPDRRGWEVRLSPLKKALEKGKVTIDSSVTELFGGIVGLTAASSFVESLKKSDRPFEGSMVLESFKTVLPKIKSWSNNENLVRSDLIKITSDNIINYIKHSSTLKEKEIKNLCAYIEVIPRELAKSFALHLLEINYIHELITDKNNSILYDALDSKFESPEEREKRHKRAEEKRKGGTKD